MLITLLCIWANFDEFLPSFSSQIDYDINPNQSQGKAYLEATLVSQELVKPIPLVANISPKSEHFRGASRLGLIMVFFFTSTVVDPPVTLFMGLDKHENEELIKWGWPEDVWFHVDKVPLASHDEFTGTP